MSREFHKRREEFIEKNFRRLAIKVNKYFREILINYKLIIKLEIIKENINSVDEMDKLLNAYEYNALKYFESNIETENIFFEEKRIELLNKLISLNNIVKVNNYNIYTKNMRLSIENELKLEISKILVRYTTDIDLNKYHNESKEMFNQLIESCAELSNEEMIEFENLFAEKLIYYRSVLKCIDNYLIEWKLKLKDEKHFKLEHLEEYNEMIVQKRLNLSQFIEVKAMRDWFLKLVEIIFNKIKDNNENKFPMIDIKLVISGEVNFSHSLSLPLKTSSDDEFSGIFITFFLIIRV